MGYLVYFDSTVKHPKHILDILNDDKSWGIPFDRAPHRNADVYVSMHTTREIQDLFPNWSEPELSMTVFGKTEKPWIIFNKDNWTSVPKPAKAIGHDMVSYRIYVVNHEFGHFLKKGHVKDRKGRCRVMYQQTKGGQCSANSWPYGSDS